MLSGSPLDSSAQFAPVTPADDKQLTYHGVSARAKAFYIVTTGNLVIKDTDGGTVTFANVLQGVVYPFSTNVVMAATTATVIALF